MAETIKSVLTFFDSVLESSRLRLRNLLSATIIIICDDQSLERFDRIVQLNNNLKSFDSLCGEPGETEQRRHKCETCSRQTYKEDDCDVDDMFERTRRRQILRCLEEVYRIRRWIVQLTISKILLKTNASLQPTASSYHSVRTFVVGLYRLKLLDLF